jgi:hypothetical protein
MIMDSLSTRCRALALALLVTCLPPVLAMDVAILDRPSNDMDRRRDYTMVLLKAVLETTRASFGPYRIEMAPFPMERPRLLQEMLKGRNVNIAANPIDAEWMQKLPSVPIPIDLGLQSWRLMLVHDKNQLRVSELAMAGQLRQATAGTGGGWALHHYLVGHGYPTITGNSYEGLFHMLNAGRFDYMLRGVHEVFYEYDAYRERLPHLSVANGVLLHARIPALFFVSPRETRLHRRIQLGMEALLKGGKLERLMLKHYRRDLERARLCERQRIELPGSETSPAIQNRHELWFNPFEPRHGLCPQPIRQPK